jgi:hypothetical protein
MKKVVFLILAGLLPLACVTAPPPGELETEQLMDRFITGLGEENIDVLMGTYWPEAEMVMIQPDGNELHFNGIEEIRKLQLEGFQDPARRNLKFGTPEGEVQGSSATYRILVQAPAAQVMNRFELARRDGRWGIIRQVLEVLPPEQSQGNTSGQRYPGPPEATPLLEAWERVVRTRDLDLLKKIMPRPFLHYTQETGEVVTFQGLEAFATFRLDYFTGLGPRENYRLPRLKELYTWEIFNVYYFAYEQQRTDERFYIARIDGRWRIDHVDMVTFKDGPFVTNKLQALGDRNGDGFITPEDGSPTFSEMVHWFFSGPHNCRTPYDDFFDEDRDGYISEKELNSATEVCFRRGFRFVRDLDRGMTREVDLNDDGGLDDGEIDRIADFMLGKTELPYSRDRFLNALWWFPMPDALFQDVPREVSNYIDELADGNGDGRIDQVEQRIILSSLTEYHKATNYFERAIDRNRDGGITWNEERLVMQAAAMGWGIRSSTRPPFPVITAVDALLDANRDALVDAREIQQVVVLFSGETGAATSVSKDLRMFLDLDGNGSLERGEIEMGKAKLLFPRRIDTRNRTDRAWDRDGNGYLDASELGITAGDSSGNPLPPFHERIDLYRRQGDTGRIAREKEAIAAGRDISPIVSASGYSDRTRDLKGKHLAVLEVKAGLVAMDPKVTKILTLFIENAFVNLSSATIVDRRNLDNVMDEMSIQASGIVDEDTAIKVGKLSGAEVIAVGEINQLEDTYYLNVKLISVETGEILGCCISTAQDTEEFLEMANRVVDGLF